MRLKFKSKIQYSKVIINVLLILLGAAIPAISG